LVEETDKDATLKEGSSEAESAEATFVAAALRAGASVVHGTHLLK
jgi:hypothetical protein